VVYGNEIEIIGRLSRDQPRDFAIGRLHSDNLVNAVGLNDFVAGIQESGTYYVIRHADEPAAYALENGVLRRLITESEIEQAKLFFQEIHEDPVLQEIEAQ
jgi:hypothetical protein